MRLLWHPLARVDFMELMTYIARESPVAAYRVHKEIESQIGVLAEYPDRGRLGQVAGTRELVINRTPYVAAYRVASGTVHRSSASSMVRENGRVTWHKTREVG